MSVITSKEEDKQNVLVEGEQNFIQESEEHLTKKDIMLVHKVFKVKLSKNKFNCDFLWIFHAYYGIIIPQHF
jgi:hypothetical protein